MNRIGIFAKRVLLVVAFSTVLVLTGCELEEQTSASDQTEATSGCNNCCDLPSRDALSGDSECAACPTGDSSEPTQSSETEAESEEEPAAETAPADTPDESS